MSTPMIVPSFDSYSGTHQAPTISQLFAGITLVAAKGLKFEFSEELNLGKTLNEEMLVYTPVLSLFKLRFKSHLNLPKIQFETSRDSIFNVLTPSAVVRTKLPIATLKLLEHTSMDAIDTDRSYFALKWQFQMSLTSKIS